MKIFITGANRGLGLSLATIGAERGHTILAGVRQVDQAKALNQLKERFPEKVWIYHVDVANEDSITEAAKTIAGELGSIDVIINNAGILLGRDNKIEEIDFKDIEDSFSVNLYGPMRVVKHFLPLLSKGVNPAIINVSSESGSIHNSYGGDYPYAISKTGLNMFSEQLSKLLREKNTLVYAVHPGWIKTDMGGEKAPGSPIETANGILDIVERKKKVTSEYSFIDHEGNPMQI